jgi:hypothetical protein
MSTNDSKKKSSYVILITAVTFLIILLCIQLFFSFFLDDYVEDRLTDAVTDQTEGQYELMLDDLSLSFWGRSLEIDHGYLQPVDSSSYLPQVELDSLLIEDIEYLPYLTNGSIQVGDMNFYKPTLTLVEKSTDSLQFQNISGRDSGHTSIPVVEIEEIDINGGVIRYWKPQKSGTRGEAHSVNLQFNNIRIDSASALKLPYAEFENLKLTSGPLHYELKNGLYSIRAKGVNLSTENQMATLDSLQLKPNYPRYEFAKEVGHQIDRFDLVIGDLQFEGAEVEKLKSGEFRLEKMGITNADLNVFRDKELPRPHKRPKKLVPVAFKEWPVPVSIDTIEVRKTTIRYSEQLKRVSEPGSVTFANLNGTFLGVTNDSTTLREGHTTYLDVTTEVMNEATLEAHFEFPMHLNGRHRASGSLGTLKTEKLNPILEPVGLIRAESGTIHSLYFDMNLGPEESNGVVELKYSDLKIDVLDADNVDGEGRQFFKSILANLLKVKDDNNNEPLRKGEVSFERVQYKAIFNYWWKSLSSGLKDSIGI